MTFSEYMLAVIRGHNEMKEGLEPTFPRDPRVPTCPTFSNNSGVIFNISWGRFSHLAIIESFAGSIRSNHYHRTDSHFIMVLDGKMEYFWRKRKEDGGREKDVNAISLSRGEVIFTPPLITHAVFFPTTTRILALSYQIRTHQEHEADLVREPILSLNEGRPVLIEDGKC